MTDKDPDLGLGLMAGDRHYRAWIDHPADYDIASSLQFNFLTFLGLREGHSVLDLGCGSLRLGRLLLPYLLPGRYCGIEPQNWLIEEGIQHNVGQDLINLKKPVFDNNDQFDLGVFNRKFDFIMTHEVFCHATAEQIKKCISEVKEVLTPTGFFAATFEEGEEDNPNKNWTYPQTVSYTMRFMEKTAEECGLKCRKVEWYSHTYQVWVLFYHPGNEENIPSFFDDERYGSNPSLKNEVEIYKSRLRRIEKHPYFIIGFKVKRFLRIITFGLWK